MAFRTKIYSQAILLGILTVCTSVDVMAFCVAGFAAYEALALHVSVNDAFVMFFPFLFDDSFWEQ